MTTPASVVFDVNILVGAALGGTSPFRSWPAVPPTTENPFADGMGIIVDAREFALFLSPHIVDNTKRVLTNVFAWDEMSIRLFTGVLAKTVVNSGGDVIDPPRTRQERSTTARTSRTTTSSTSQLRWAPCWSCPMTPT